MKASKHCNKCDATKSIDEFHKNSHGKHSVSHMCKVCSLAYADAYRKANPIPDWRLRKFGLSRHDYDQLFKLSGGKCQVCELKTSKLCIDHNHRTGWVRGLLCDSCNVAIGRFKENVQALRNAANYLETLS